MTVEARAQGGVMDWQERLWGRVQRAGDWPDRTLEIVCSVTALSFFLSALIYDYFPFFALGASFTAVGWLVEEKRRTDEARLLAPVWGLLRRCLTRPVRTVTAAALLVVGVWREAVWIALVGLVVLRWAVRQAREAAARRLMREKAMPSYKVHRAVMRLVAAFDRRSPLEAGEVEVRNICLVNTTALGDTLLSSPAIRAVRGAYPESRLVSLVHRRSRDVLRYNPHLDELITYPGKYRGVRALLGQLRAERFDLVIILHANDPDVVPLVYFTGAPLRAGWAESQMNFLLTHTYRRPTGPPVHTIENRLGILASVGIPPDGVAMEMHYGSEEREFAERFFQDFQIDPAQDIVVGVHPFASRSEKAWPDGHALDLLRRLELRAGVRPLVVGGGENRERADAWRAKLPPQVPLSVGMGSINHTAALVDMCDLFITTDSGPFHLAVALGVPTIMLVGPTKPAVTGPYQDRERHTVVKATAACPECAEGAERVAHSCMAALTPERVMAVVKERLQALHSHR